MLMLLTTATPSLDNGYSHTLKERVKDIMGAIAFGNPSKEKTISPSKITGDFWQQQQWKF